jgi:L-ascorbate metabolism protein UlaG (beta-lactamase superfamily)
MAVTTLEWYGTSTFRLRVRGLTLFFDCYVDRPPGMDDVGLTTAAIDDADFVFISHAHFDHVLGADTIAAATGATVVGSYEVARVLTANGVAPEQIIAVSGGEPVDCGHGVRVRPYPSLHSCLFASGTQDSGAECLGDLGVSAQDRIASVERTMALISHLGPELATWFAERDPHCSHRDGGQLSYLVETPDGGIFVNGSSGYWTGIVRDLRPDVAIMALAGRPNVDGEPHQGSLATFLREQAELVRPDQVILCHHDPLLPAMPGVDIGEAVATIGRDVGYAQHVAMNYNEPVAVLTR